MPEEMQRCVQRGIQVTNLSSFFEREAAVVMPSIVVPSWPVFSVGVEHPFRRRLSKRLIDIAATSCC